MQTLSVLAVILINIGLLTLLKVFLPHGNFSSNKILHVKRAALVEVEQRTYKSRLAQLPLSAVAGNTPCPVGPPPWLWSPEGPHLPGCLGPCPVVVHVPDRPWLRLLSPFLMVCCQWARKSKRKEATLVRCSPFLPSPRSSVLQVERLHHFGHSLLKMVHGHPWILVLILGKLKIPACCSKLNSLIAGWLSPWGATS